MFLYPEDDCQADNEDDHAHGEETPVQGRRGFQKDATWEQFNKKCLTCKMVLFKKCFWAKIPARGQNKYL